MNKNEKGIYLTNKDAEVFFDALDNPPEANNKLRNAIRNYRSNYNESDSNQDSIALLKILAMSSKSRKDGKSKPIKTAFADIRGKIGTTNEH